jgi:poly(hydroxyalkanoate) depolymerase family esterase
MWKRIREFAARLLRRAPLAPGRFVEDRKFSWRGWLSSSPWTWPSRDYLVYVPRGYGGWKRRPLVVFIHGCKQTPEDFAAATRIAALADDLGWLLLLPRQTNKANPWSCWNWFDDATVAGRGEAAIVAAQVNEVRRAYRVHPRRIFVAGLSAGACLAAVLGVRHPKLFAGVFAHSGVACGAASGALAAMNVLKRGAEGDVEAIARKAREEAPRNALPLPLLAIHGGRDNVVAETNAVQLVRQYLVLNGIEPDGARDAWPRADDETTSTLPGGRTMRTADYRAGGRPVVRAIRVSELAHGWSGGDPAFPYNDPDPPDATVLLGDFVAENSRRELRRLRWPFRA